MATSGDARSASSSYSVATNFFVLSATIGDAATDLELADPPSKAGAFTISLRESGDTGGGHGILRFDNLACGVDR